MDRAGIGDRQVAEVSAVTMRRAGSREVSFGGIAWLVIGLVVASSNHFFDQLDTVSRFLSAVLAVAAWPLVLADIHLGI